MKKKRNSFFKNFFSGFTPVAWVFFAALVMVVFGLGIPGLTFLAKLGAFIIVVYAVIWVIWAIFFAKGY